MEPLNPEKPLQKCPNPKCTLDTSRYFNEGPLKGTYKYCYFCNGENFVNYVPCKTSDLQIRFCEGCKDLIERFLKLQKHSFTIGEFNGIIMRPYQEIESYPPIKIYITRCDGVCRTFSTEASEKPGKCEVMERLEDITYWPTKGLSPMVLLKKLVNALEKPCHICSSSKRSKKSKSKKENSSCLVINRICGGTLDYDPIFQLCDDCFVEYSLKHKYYPSHYEMCPKKYKCDMKSCGYDWNRLSGCIECGRDRRQILCDDECEFFNKL